MDSISTSGSLINNMISYDLTRSRPYPFYIVWGGITYPGNVTDPSTFRNFYTLQYIYEGSGVIYRQNKNISVSAGDFQILTPGYYYDFFADKNNPWKILWCSLPNTPFMSGLLSAYNIGNIKNYSKINSPLYLEDILGILKKQNSDEKSFRIIEECLFMTVCELSDFASQYIQPASLAELGKAYIDTSSIDTSINSICKQLSISTSHFFRLFKKEFGISPQEYITKKKMDIAIDSLKYSSLNINRISELAGYESISSFSNTFYKKIGMTPSEFRKKYFGNPDSPIYTVKPKG